MLSLLIPALLFIGLLVSVVVDANRQPRNERHNLGRIK